MDISPLFFHVVSKFVQALVIIYDEVFQALAVEGDVLFPKPFLDPKPTHLTAPTRPPWTSCVRQTGKKIFEAGDFYLTTRSKLKSRSHFWTSVFGLSAAAAGVTTLPAVTVAVG
jgi:hypothetical protein